MGKKKPFIDKKNSSTYHLIYRSQRDVAGDEDDDGGAAGVVLWPSPNNNKLTDQKVLLGGQGKKKQAAQFEDATNQEGAQQQNDGSTLNQWKFQLSGLVDEYDYDKHMKPISGSGTMLTAASAKNAPNEAFNPKGISTMIEARSMDVREEIVNEVDRQLESIALSADCMDPEIAAALFGDFDEAEYEELNDEYFLDAAKEPEPDAAVAGGSGAAADNGDGFDFAAHVKMLMERAKQESNGMADVADDHRQGMQDMDFFRKAKPLHSVYEELEDESLFGGVEYHGDGGIGGGGAFESLGVAPKLSSAEEQALIDKFNETLLEYDSDEVGEGLDDYEAAGHLALEGDAQVEAALNDYLTDRNDEFFIQGATPNMGPDSARRTGSSGFSALVGTRMVPVKELEKDADHVAKVSDAPPISEVIAEANIVLSDPLAAPPEEDVLIDGKSYFSERMRNPWDCESILSTYSNLDNNPVTIQGGSGRRRRKKGKSKNSSSSSASSVAGDDESVQQIMLSDKTGLPLGVLPEHGGANGDAMNNDDQLATDTYMSVNKGEPRKKKETAEEKRMRKQNVKVERQVARMQKKMMKEAFSFEFGKRATEVMQDDVGGTTVFRF